MKRKQIVIGNWKMAPKTLKEAKQTFQGIKKVAGTLRHVQTVVCAPAVFLPELKKLVTGHRCVIGAQNISHYKEDAHTGETSIDMVHSVGAQYVIVGHSERRAEGETDEQVAEKTQLVVKKGLTAVVCVGESQRDDEGRYTLYVKEQLLSSLSGFSARQLDKLIVAYEPVWAIGAKAKREATLEDVQEMGIFIRKVLVDAFGQKKGAEIPILYGGSVNPTNTPIYIEGADMDGFLVGRASLKTASFEKILKASNA